MSTTTKPVNQLGPATLVVFGITGDLASRKLLPALYSLLLTKLLPKQLRIIGISRREIAISDILSNVRKSIHESGQTVHNDTLEALGKHIEILEMNMLDGKAYGKLDKRLNEIEDEHDVCMSRLFYLAIPSHTFMPVVAQIGKNGLNKSCQHDNEPVRLLIEKPFGYDLESARQLITEMGEYFHEDQIYRIDHYLAKETVQNMLTFRFQNPIFKRSWNNQSISHVMITAAEKIDIEGRAAFYEQTGALRDFIQSHLLQLVALTLMDEPAALNSDEIHTQKIRLLQSIAPLKPNTLDQTTVRGQYEGYRQEVDNGSSNIETYAAIALSVDTERWRGVPVILRTGKALAEKVTDITLVFNDKGPLTHDNALTIRIQPNEGISLRLFAKKPGFTNEIEPVQMDFCYRNAFTGQTGSPDAYERVLVDAFGGDKTLFATSDEVIASWKIIDNVIHEWSKDDHSLQVYKKDSWGPEGADTLAEQYNTAWITQDVQLCDTHIVE